MSKSIRLVGSIISKTPVMITRPDQGPGALSMTIMVGGQARKAPVIPGETIKGVLRGLALSIVSEAGLSADPKAGMSLDRLYQQGMGGVEFKEKSRKLGEREALRARNPLLSLFGAAEPILEGRLTVEPAVGPGEIVDAKKGITSGLAGGSRQDPVLQNPYSATLLSDADKDRWSSQQGIVAEASAAKAAVKAAERALGKARQLLVEDLSLLESNVAEAKKALGKIEANPDFTNAIQRPLDEKAAAPAGVEYSHSFELLNASDVEIGLFLAALDRWSESFRIGGGKTTGFGRLSAAYTLEILSKEGGGRTWRKIGDVVFDGLAGAVRTDHAAIVEARGAWAQAESDILTAYDIFDRVA
jgi:CRISPR type IV-associated protein Csf2